MPKSPSPDSGIDSRERTDPESDFPDKQGEPMSCTCLIPKQGAEVLNLMCLVQGDSCSELARFAQRQPKLTMIAGARRLRRISSRSSLGDELPERRASKRARARISDSSEALEPDDAAKASDGDSEEEELVVRRKRRRVVEEEDSDWEARPTKAKSSKDQLRNVRAKNRARRQRDVRLCPSL